MLKNKRWTQIVVLMLSITIFSTITDLVPVNHQEITTVYAKRRHGAKKKAFFYARRYWHHANTKQWGGRFSEDCTNYASQIMHTKYRRKFGWFLYGGHSYSWINVNSFWKYWTKARHHHHRTFRTQRSVRRYAHEGDVIQFYEKRHGKKHHRKGGWFHSVVVHYKTRHDIYYTAHTSDHLHKGLRNANKGRQRRGIHKIIKYRVIHMGF